jgi:hypothetical protein
MSSEIAAHICLPEPKLAFHPERVSDREIHPLLGLIRFGPYSSGLVPDPIRVATITPTGDSSRLFDFMKELHKTAKAGERADYLPDWPGFHRVFGLHMGAASRSCHVELDAPFEEEFANSSSPHIVLADRLVRNSRFGRSPFRVRRALHLHTTAMGARLCGWPRRGLRSARPPQGNDSRSPTSDSACARG